AGAGIATRLAALIALRIAQPIRLGIEQSVQRFLHGPPHHPLEVALDPFIVNRDDIVSADSVYRLTWRLPLAGLVAFRHLQFSQIRGRQPYLIVRKIPYLIGWRRDASERCKASTRTSPSKTPCSGPWSTLPSSIRSQRPELSRASCSDAVSELEAKGTEFHAGTSPLILIWVTL